MSDETKELHWWQILLVGCIFLALIGTAFPILYRFGYEIIMFYYYIIADVVGLIWTGLKAIIDAVTN